MPEYQKVASVGEIPPNGRKSLIFADQAVLLFRVGDDYYAVEDICSHDGQPLTEGRFEGTSIECPRHGARFDVRTGRPLCMPAVEPISTFDVKVADSEIFLREKT